MKRSLPRDPRAAYRLVQRLAKKHKMSVSAWAESRGVRKSTVSHWIRRKQKTVMLSTLKRLGVRV